jgi:FPC/CPF motif-containing protein YcgG
MKASLEHLEAAWRINPFTSDTARGSSQYYGTSDGGAPMRLLEMAPVTPFARIAHDAFRSFVFDEKFSCLGAKAALRKETYRFGAYDMLDDAAVTEGLARDLTAFAAERAGFESDFTTFVAFFRGPVAVDERAFHDLLWDQLKRLHEIDKRYNAWDPKVSDDPSDPNFSFSIAGKAFFVVGLHPEASRESRRFSWPTLVFNAHEQFENLKEDGRFTGLQSQIRKREVLLEGTLNPNLADFGDHSEARQYSGMPLGDKWQCPFRSRD